MNNFKAAQAVQRAFNRIMNNTANVASEGDVEAAHNLMTQMTAYFAAIGELGYTEDGETGKLIEREKKEENNVC